MKSKDSGGPNGQIESIELSNEKKKNKFEKSQTWVPCENDTVVTTEVLNTILEQEAGRELESNLRNFIRRYFNDRETVEDICQDVLVTMLTKVKEEKIYLSGLNRYVGKIAYGLILNKRRHWSRTKTEPLNGDYGERHEFELPQRRKAETVVLLKEIFNFLDQKEKLIFALTFHGFNDDEIADKLDITANNVRQIRYRAFKKLAKWIEQGKYYENTFGR